MLPISTFKKTNFSDGMIFNPLQIKMNDENLTMKLSLISRYGIGKGVLIGFEQNLKVGIKKGQLYLYPGAAINENGDIIYVDKEVLLLKDLQTNQFANKETIHIYLKYVQNMEDFKASRNVDDEKLYYKIAETYSIEIHAKSIDNKELFEIGRIYINHDLSNNISEAINPYNPVDNEIDLRFTSKIIPDNSIITVSEIIMMTNVIRRYADFLTEMAYRKSLFTAANAASFANKIVIDFKSSDLSAWKLYEILSYLVHISSEIKDEKSEIINTGFWKNILRLQNLFSFSERFEADYYNILLNVENSFFSKVFLHFDNASIFDGNWDVLMQDSENKVNIEKDYLIAGSSAHCDIQIEGDDIEDEHAHIYPHKEGYFIEDISHSSGVYINAMRLETGVKKFIRNQDYVTLGKNGKILNLNNT